jgi:hypothetical protein
MVANPNLSLQKCSALAKKTDLDKGVDSFETYLFPDNQVHYDRHCVLCAKSLFHPAVYGLRSLTRCPVHHIPFTNRCPDCGHSWERPLSRKNPVCSTCGSPPYQALGRARFKKRDYRRLQWLNNWLSSCQSKRKTQTYPELFDIYRQLRALRNIESPRFQQPGLDHIFYVAFESQKWGGTHNQRLASLHACTHDKALRSRATILTNWLPPAWPEHLSAVDMPDPPHVPQRETVLTFIGIAIRRILRWQRDVIGIPHRLNWYDIRSIRPEQVRNGSPPCVLCMAFSFWCRAIALKFVDPDLGGEPGDHEICRFVHYFRYPNIPEGVYLEDDQGGFYRPSKSFERWLFMRSSDFAFMEFVRLASWIYERSAIEKAQFRQTSYPLSEKFKRPTLPSEILELRWRKNELKAVFWPESPLNDAVLSGDEIRKVQRCAAFLSGDCHRIWSVDPDPSCLHRNTIARLVDETLPNSKMRPYLYPWTDHYPVNKPSIGIIRSENDMRVVARNGIWHS